MPESNSGPDSRVPRQRTRLEKVALATGISGASIALLGFGMLFAGQTGSLRGASPRELAGMPTTPVEGRPFSKAIDKSGAFKEYMALLKQWNGEKPLPDSAPLEFQVALVPDTPSEARRRIRALEQELASVRLLRKVGSRNSYKVRLSTESLILGSVVSRPVFRSRWWENLADYALAAIIPGMLLVYLGIGLYAYQKRKLKTIEASR